MNEKKILKEFKDISTYIDIIDGEKIIGEIVNELNNTVYIIENEKGERYLKLYNEIDYNRMKLKEIIKERYFNNVKKLKRDLKIEK